MMLLVYLFPMVMNYHADIVHDQTSNPTTFKVQGLLLYGTMAVP